MLHCILLNAASMEFARERLNFFVILEVNDFFITFAEKTALFNLGHSYVNRCADCWFFLKGKSLAIQWLTERTNRKCLVKYVRRTCTLPGTPIRHAKTIRRETWTPARKSLLFFPTTLFTRHTYEMTFDIRYFCRCRIFNMNRYEPCYRYQFFLQLKQDILQGRVPVSQELMAELGAYVVQCEYKYIHY